MMKKLTEMVKGKKTEHEKNIEELSLVNGTITELDNKLGKLKVLLQGAKLETELIEDSAVKTRMVKIEEGIEKISVELFEKQERARELQEAISAENERLKNERIKELAQMDVEEILKTRKAKMLERELEKIQATLERRGGTGVIMSQAFNLKRHAGLRSMDNFDPRNPAHSELMKVAEEILEPATEKAKEELAELMKQIRKFIG